MIVNDGVNSSIPDEVTITVANPNYNESPVIHTILNQTISEGATANVLVSSSDADGDGIIFSAPLIPDFATLFDYTNGTAKVSISPGYGDAGNHSITLRVTDGRNSTLHNEKSFGVIVTDQAIPPVATNDGIITTLEDVPVLIDVLHNDYDTDYTSANGTGASFTDDSITSLYPEAIPGVLNSEGTFVAYHSTISSTVSHNLAINSAEEILDSTNYNTSSEIMADIIQSKESLDLAKHNVTDSSISFESSKQNVLEELSQYRVAVNLYGDDKIDRKDLLEQRGEFLSSKSEYSDTKQTLKESHEILDEIRADLKVESQINLILEEDSSQNDKIPVYVEITNNIVDNIADDISGDTTNNISNTISDILDVTTQHENILVTTVTQSELQSLAQSDDVKQISIPHLPELFDVSQGVALSSANNLHLSGVTGENVTVAVIDNSFILSDDKITENIVYSALFDSVGFCNGDISCGKSQSNSHGTAVAGIITDMAPDVSLEVYAITNSVDFVNAISQIIQRGEANVISISLGFPTLGGDGTTGYFRDGTSHVAQAVDLARNAGIVVVSAAGNDGNRHWYGSYGPSEMVSPDDIGLTGYQSVMEFASENTGSMNVCLPISHNSLTMMSWDDWYTSSQNYDLFLYDGTMSNILRDSRANQNEIPGIPLERIYGSTINSACLVIASYNSTQNHNFHVYSVGGSINDTLGVSGHSVSTPADTINAITVGAINYNDNSLESFSSRGPTDDGREKPEICGYDKVQTGVSLFNPFAGTSSAAPHVAGGISLLFSAFPSYSADTIEGMMLENAKTGTYADSNLCGAGVISLLNITNQTISGENTNQTNTQVNPYQLTIDNIIAPNNGTATINDGAIVYFPNPNYFGDDSFGYVISDTDGLLSNVGYVSVSVTSVNDPPVILDISDVTVSEGTAKTIPITVTDINETDNITISTNGTLPSFANFIDNTNGTAIVTLSPTVTDSGNYTIQIIANDSGVPEVLSDDTTFTVTVTDADITPPVISLIGDNTITVPLGELFSDPGITVIDNVDGDIANLVVIDGVVNTLLPDVYDIVYTATDSSGNKSQVTRQVTVSNTASTISTVYGDGTDGNLQVTNTVILSGIKNYKNVIVRDGGIITVPQGETLYLKINGTLAFESGGTINADGKGSAGGAGGHSIPGAGGAGGTRSSHSSFTCSKSPIGCMPWYSGFPGGAPSTGSGGVGEMGGTGKSGSAGGSSSDYAGGTSASVNNDIVSFDSIAFFVQTQQKLFGGAGGSGGAGAQSGYGTDGGAGHSKSYRQHEIVPGTTGTAGAQSAIGGDGGNGGGAISISTNILYGDVSITARGHLGEPGESARGISVHGAGGGAGGSGGIIGIIYSQLLQSEVQSLGFDYLDGITLNDSPNYSSHTLDESSITINVDGGIGGAGGDADTGGTNGNSGGAGYDGVIFLQQISGFDSIKPQISLLGDDPLDVRFGSQYADPGGIITDNDVAYSGDVFIDSSNVMMNTLGTYYTTYTGTPDPQGNIPQYTTRTINVIPNPIFGYGTDGSFDVIGDVTIPSGTYHYDDLTIHDNSNLITNGKTIIYVNGTYLQIGSGQITVNPTGCSGGAGGSTQGGAGGNGGGFVISSKLGLYGLPGLPGQPPVTVQPQLASQCNTLSDVSTSVDIMDISDTFAEYFMSLDGSQGSDGTGAASSGHGGTGGPGYYYRFSGPDRYGFGQTGGDGGTGSQGVNGVSGGGTLGIFVKSIDSDSMTISANGNDGNDGNSGTADSGEPGAPARESRVRINIYWVPASYPGGAASSAGTAGSDGSQGGIVYLGYGTVPSGFAANIDVSGGTGGIGGNDANGSTSSQTGATGNDGYFFVQKVTDTFPPMITLNGDALVTLEYGDDYTDPGAAASDGTDGDITNMIIVDNPVNSTQVGTYHITYDVADAARNSAVQITRTVNVVDTVPPVIAIRGATQITAEYGGYADDDDFTDGLLQAAALFSDGIDDTAINSVTDNATSQNNTQQLMTIIATDPVDGQVPITIHDSAVDLFKVGEYAITYTAADKNGNAAIPVYSTVLVQDTTPPDISLIGGDVMNTDYGIPFADPGVVAADPIDGDLTTQVTVIKMDAIDTGKISTYSIDYIVTDSNGNVANVTRTVQVYEKTLSAMESLPFNYTAIDSEGIAENADAASLPKTIMLDVDLDTVMNNTDEGGTANNDGDGQQHHDMINGTALMKMLAIPQYDLTEKYNSTTLSTITVHDDTTQYSMTPPVTSWIPNEMIKLEIDKTVMPEFGGVLQMDAYPSGMTNSSTTEWLAVQANPHIPDLYSTPILQDKEIHYDMFVDIKYPYNEGKQNATDWSDGVSHREKPAITVLVPKPASDGNVTETTSDGCLILEPLYYDEESFQWIQGHARIIHNEPFADDGTFCKVVMETDHFSSFALVGTSSSGGGSDGNSPSDSSSTGGSGNSNGKGNRSGGGSSSSGSHGSPTSSEAIARLQEIKDSVVLQNKYNGDMDMNKTSTIEPALPKLNMVESGVTDENISLTDDVIVESLKQQIANEVSLDQIICNGTMELIFKTSDGSPVCVTPETKSKLVERGWGFLRHD